MRDPQALSNVIASSNHAAFASIIPSNDESASDGENSNDSCDAKASACVMGSAYAMANASFVMVSGGGATATCGLTESESGCRIGRAFRHS